MMFHLLLPIAETTGTQTQALLSLSQQHALLFYRDTCNLVSKVTDSEHFHTNGVSAALSSVSEQDNLSFYLIPAKGLLILILFYSCIFWGLIELALLVQTSCVS